MARHQAMISGARLHHRAGRYQQAEALCREIVQADPRCADAWGLLGELCQEAGNEAGAVDCYQRTLRLDPGNPSVWNNLGIVLMERGQLERAVASYEEALRFDPAYPEARNNLGIALMEQGKLLQAVEQFKKALHLRPTYPEAHNNLGNALGRQGKLTQALAAYREAIRLKPDYSEAHANQGTALRTLGRLEDAVAAYQQALQLKPERAELHNDLGVCLLELGETAEAARCIRQALVLKPAYPEAHNNLAIVLMGQGQPREGVAHCQEALRLRPDYPEAHNNLGNAMLAEGLPQEAVRRYEQALQFKPDYAEALNNLGNAHGDLGSPAEAILCYERALALKPAYPDAHMNLAMNLLATGDLGRGWEEYEWRWRVGASKPREFPQPRWDGSPLDGRTILLYAEQGLGDSLQFIRYASLVRARGGRVLFECQKVLRRILARCAGIDELIPAGEPLPPFDVEAPLLSLPGLLGTTEDTIPADVPYLAVEPALVASWRDELAQYPDFKVGIAWQGSKDYKGDKFRSMPLASFAGLAEVPGVRLISMQKGYGEEQIAQVDFPVTTLSRPVDQESGPFVDTAAILQNLDLFITSDSAVAHLAGGLGVPVWLLTPFAPDWRWQRDREDSPWYPTMRLFRQERRCDWHEVFARVGEALHGVVNGSPLDVGDSKGRSRSCALTTS